MVAAMKMFPNSVCEAMQASGASITAVPVRLDDREWEAAIFFHLAGPESKADRRILAKSQRTFPIALETDLIEQAQAAVIVLRVEVHTQPENPLAGEILLTPGAAPAHHEVLKLLSQQPRLCWFFANEDFQMLYSQEHPLTHEQHAEFADLMRDAVRHDTLIRCTGRYDAQAALSEIIGHYDPRASSGAVFHSGRGGKVEKGH